MRNQKTNQLNQKASNESAQVNQIVQTNQVIQNSSEPNFNEIQNSHNQNDRNQPNILEGYFQNSQNVVDNGSTRENIYANTNATLKIGSLNRREQCDCLGIFKNRPIVIYRVNDTDNYKTGFAI